MKTQTALAIGVVVGNLMGVSFFDKELVMIVFIVAMVVGVFLSLLWLIARGTIWCEENL